MPEFNLLFLANEDLHLRHSQQLDISAPNVDPVGLADLVDHADLVDLVDHLDHVPVDFHWSRHLLCPFLWPRLSWNDGGQGTKPAEEHVGRLGMIDDTVPGYHVGFKTILCGSGQAWTQHDTAVIQMESIRCYIPHAHCCTGSASMQANNE